MNSSPRNQRSLVSIVLISVKRLSSSRRQRSLQLLGLMVALLLANCSAGQAFSQSPISSHPEKWISLVLPAIQNAPNFNNPLKDLRQPDPSGLLSEDLALEQIAGNTNYSHGQQRYEPTLVMGWSQPGLRHRKLYFEDDQIERGNVARPFPNVTAGGKFFKSLIAFPIRLISGQ